VVINYDGGDVTLKCLRALFEQTYPRALTEVVVVDNASVDGLAWKIPRAWPEAVLVNLLTNEGFARGNNLAMSDLSGIDVVALLNNDTIPEPTWLEELVAALKHDESVGAVCSKMVFNKKVLGIEIESDSKPIVIRDVNVDSRSVMDSVVFDERCRPVNTHDKVPSPMREIKGVGSLWFEPAEKALAFPAKLTIVIEASGSCDLRVRTASGTSLTSIESGVSTISVEVGSLSDVINNAGGGVFPGMHGGDIGFKEVDFGQYEEAREVFSFCGGAVALRGEALREVGLFDPSFFLYYEDMDLSWRMRYAGWKISYAPKSVVRHEHAFSSGEWSPFFRFWVDRNRRLTLVKNAPLAVAAKAVVGATVWAVRDSFVPILRSIIRLHRPSFGASVYRLKQYGSFVKALPAAVGARRRQLKSSELKPDFVYSWISTR
jgi:GT2 family glycosyltransferase